jgi:putative oxidoreductase
VLSIALVFAARFLLVVLFLPFSALDKVLNPRAAVGQTAEVVGPGSIAWVLTTIAFCLEVLMSLAILTGIADRLAALVLGGYCLTTALFWKQFWKGADFALRGKSQSREVFWDFLKNVGLAGGFLLLAVGANVEDVHRILDHPLVSSHPYRIRAAE